MKQLPLHEFHHSLGAKFSELNNAEIVADYGGWLAEHKALRESAGVIDLSFRSRICVVGNDRIRFLHGQVTNDVKKLRVGEGCYAAITTAKGKMESDLNIFNLQDELLLDFEPGLTGKISARLEKFIVADDVQIVDAAPHYGLLSVQGPKAENVVRSLNLFSETPSKQFDSVKISDATLGEIYLAKNSRLDSSWWGERPREPQTNQVGSSVASPHQNGFDLFVPNNSLGAVADKLIAAAKQIGGHACGWTAVETARIENGIPRFGADMDETNLPLECGIESRAVSYNKGCYIGQEVINRIHSIGHVNKELRGLRLADSLKSRPARNDKLFFNGKEVGYVTSAVKSPLIGNIALGYVRREANQIGNELTLQGTGESLVKIVELPFVK
ncbi:MAG: YgfZ/GcvT domain-containing protein [Limisphaerales bacterium]